MELLNSIPVPVLYAIPIASVVALSQWNRCRSRRQIEKASETIARIAAEDALKEYLKTNRLDVPIEKSDDYTENDFDVAKGVVKLSPDAFGSVDVGSIAYALVAGSQAAQNASDASTLTLVSKLRRLETYGFWLVFCVLSFGIMSSSAPLTTVGYALAIAVGIVSRLRKSKVRKMNESAKRFAAESPLFAPQIASELQKTIDATLDA